MKILHISNHIQEIGNGIVNVAVDLACLQAKTGHQVAVASMGGEYEILLSNFGVHHFELDQTRKLGNLAQLVKRFRAIICEFNPDIIHAHMMTGLILAKMLRGWVDYGLVSTVHNEFQKSAILMGLADRVIAISNAVAESMHHRGIPYTKLRIVCNGTLGSPRTLPLENYDPLPLHRPAITTVAGMYQRKGISELIEAFEQIAPNFPDAHLYLVGNGPDRPLFESQAHETSVVDRIHFEGFQPSPQQYLLSTDIFVLASRREPFGLVISEAREAGCAIVASNIDGIPEALNEGKAGILVPVSNSQALATALADLLIDGYKLNQWKARSLQNLEWLNVTRVNQETLIVYQELISDRKKEYFLSKIL